MNTLRALATCLALSTAACAGAPRPAPSHGARHPRRDTVRFTLDAASSARLTPPMREVVRATLEALCRHDLDALMARLDPRSAAGQLDGQRGDRAQFFGEQLTFGPIVEMHSGLSTDPLSTERTSEMFGEVLRRAERAVVIDARPWGPDQSLVVRGTLVLNGGPMASFAFTLVPLNGSYVIGVTVG